MVQVVDTLNYKSLCLFLWIHVVLESQVLCPAIAMGVCLLSWVWRANYYIIYKSFYIFINPVANDTTNFEIKETTSTMGFGG